MKTPSNIAGRYLWFERGGMRFAAQMEHLQEVLPFSSLRKLPAAEPSLAGLMRLREYVLPVFDPLSMFQGTPANSINATNFIVLTLSGQPIFALVAEKVGQVVSLPALAPLSRPAKLPSAFSGEASLSKSEPLLVFDVHSFATTMDLARHSSEQQPALLPSSNRLRPEPVFT